MLSRGYFEKYERFALLKFSWRSQSISNARTDSFLEIGSADAVLINSDAVQKGKLFTQRQGRSEKKGNNQELLANLKHQPPWD
jgi:hypothetical protein